MPSLRDELIRLFPKILPGDPRKALTGTILIEKIKPMLARQDYSDASFRQHFSMLAADPNSPIAKVDQGQGYYLRPTWQGSLASKSYKEQPAQQVDGQPTTDEQKRTLQLEEKFRAFFMRYLTLNNLFPMHIEHTKGVKRPQA